MLWAVVWYVYDPKPPYDSEDYKAIEQIFRERTRALEQKQAKRQARFDGRSAESGNEKQQKGEEQKVDINKADVVALQTLSGIGPVMAERIRSFRNREGPFKRVEDLLQVKGIGRATLQKMRGKLMLDQERKREKRQN